jgi:hypothetical protein
MRKDAKVHACLPSNWTEIYTLAFLSPAIPITSGKTHMLLPVSRHSQPHKSRRVFKLTPLLIGLKNIPGIESKSDMS